jgi:hypothetical protein
MQKNSLSTFFKTIVLPRSQIVFLCTTALLIALMSYQANEKNYFIESMPQLLPVTPKKVREWAGASHPIKVGLHISNWVEFDVAKNNFIFDGIIWFEFDARLLSIDSVSKFSFDKADILSKEKSRTKVVNDLLHAEYEIRVRFNSDLTYQLFPFDDHAVFITLTNKILAPREATFVSYQSGFTISENATIVGWETINRKVHTGYSEGFLDEQDPQSVINNPKAVFSLFVRRSGTRQILLIFLPLLLFFFIGLFSFGFDHSQGSTMMGLASSSLGSIISYRFVIQRMSPEVGYFILSDHLFTLFLAMAFTMLFMSIVSLKLGELSERLSIVRGFIFLSFHIILLLAWYYLLFVWTT